MVTVLGDHDEKVVRQLERCVVAEEGARGALCADGHYGYSQPVGGAVAYRDHISVSGVGYDIGCGNKAVLTNLKVEDVVGTGGLSGSPVPLENSGQSEGPKNEASVHAYPRPESALNKIMDEVVRRISFGMGRANDEPVDHPVLDHIRDAEFEGQRTLRDLAAKQLGTVGAGNHYVDLFRDEQDRIWVGVHFGSRGFGHKTATGFLAIAQGKPFGSKASEGEMDAPPTLLHVDSSAGQAYIAAMKLAGEYAYAGRDLVVDKVLEILGATAEYEVHNHHNFAWHEEIERESRWVVRKGCTPAYPGQEGFVGATMGGTSVILRGTEDTDPDTQRDLLFSTVHGAGRVMSRTQAAGKKRPRWTCQNRDCDWFQPPKTHKPDACPQCGNPKLVKRWVQLTPGLIDYDQVRDELTERGIVLRGGAADEAPGAYKSLDEVLTYHGDTVEVLHALHPIGVAMAGPDIHDPYKD